MGGLWTVFRLRRKGGWMCPQRDMERGVAEVAYLASEPWAVGIMTFGNLDGMLPDHPYFDPFYRIAQDAELPICFHCGDAATPRSPGRRTAGHNQRPNDLSPDLWRPTRLASRRG